MKKIFAILSFAAVLFAACQQAEKPAEATPEALPEQETMTIYASLETPPATEASVSDAGVPAWQTGDKIALYDGSDFVEFSISNVSTGAFTGPAGTYTGLAVYPASAAVSVDGSGNLTLNLPGSYTWTEGQTNAPMIAIEDSGSWCFYPVCGMFKYTFSDILSDATTFHFTVPSKINGNFEIGVPDPGTSVISQVAAANDSEKTVAVKLPSPHPSTMSFYIPVPVSPAGYDGFAVSITADDGVPAAEVSSSANITVARSQMRRYKSKSCSDALPAKIYLIGGCFTPSWSWSEDNVLNKGVGAVYTGTVDIDEASGFKMYLNNDWNATWLSIDEDNSTASNLIVVGGETYRAAHGGADTQVKPNDFGFIPGTYNITLNLETKRLTFSETTRRKFFLSGGIFNSDWGWGFDNARVLVRQSEGIYTGTAYLYLDHKNRGFKLYGQRDYSPTVYSADVSSGATFTILDEDNEQFYPYRFGYETSGTYQITADFNQMRVFLSAQ